jgi:CBS domain-containing protein
MVLEHSHDEENEMLVNELMTREVEIIGPNETLAEAARKMAKLDVGALPVAEAERLVGMITDRDIAVRAVAEGMGPDTPVRDAMTIDVRYAYEDELVSDVADNMGELQVRRLPVVSRDKRLVGIISLADIARLNEPTDAGEALQGISRPGGSHNNA